MKQSLNIIKVTRYNIDNFSNIIIIENILIKATYFFINTYNY
jgi:hypothetical protein